VRLYSPDGLFPDRIIVVKKVVENFISSGKNQKKVNCPENKNGKKKKIIGIP
jgi:hypothetical protein